MKINIKLQLKKYNHCKKKLKYQLHCTQDLYCPQLSANKQAKKNDASPPFPHRQAIQTMPKQDLNCQDLQQITVFEFLANQGPPQEVKKVWDFNLLSPGFQ